MVHLLRDDIKPIIANNAKLIVESTKYVSSFDKPLPLDGYDFWINAQQKPKWQNCLQIIIGVPKLIVIPKWKKTDLGKRLEMMERLQR